MALASWIDPNNPERKVECYFSSGGKIGEGPVGKDIKLLPGVAKTGEADNSTCYALREDVTVSGADLKDARPGYDPEKLSGSVVNFEFNMKGAQRFGKITGEHVNEQLAVVLEDRVMSAPVIRSRIFDRGQIEGGFTTAEATDLANVLRSGALDVNIKIEEERTVGASLGADSIHKGIQAALWGSVAVVIFMVVYYSLGGVIADLALLLNILLIMAALSLFGATLTLPGLAGIVLTVGMSVDANVLIFERAREELRVGKTPRSAMEAGYSKALWTILDSNITTLIGALVLLQWGTGPIKGFAVTLSLGIIFSVFTSVVVSRIIYEVMFYYRKGAKLRIGIKVEPAAGAR
jgi:preprotein translocase subunit SecD